MTIVNKHSTSHSGLLVTGSGDDIDIDVELIGGRTLRMSASGDELGAWPIDECHIEPDPERNGTFRIIVDGDAAVFTPVDPVGFRSLVAYVTRTESYRDEEPSGLRSDTPEAAAPDSKSTSESDPSSPAAADDPVAFLFGSAPPPPPPSVDELSGSASQHVDDDQELGHRSSDDDLDPVEPADPDLDAVDLADRDLDPVEFDWDELDDIEVTIEPVSALSSPVSPIEESEFEDVSEIEEDSDRGEVPAVVSPTLAERLEEAERLEAEDSAEIADVPEVDALDAAGGAADTSAEVVQAAPTERARFGASALDRLSEAISSVTSSSSAPADEEYELEPNEEYELEPNNVADEVLSTQRSLRDHRVKGAKRSQRLKLAVIAGVAVGLIALIALLAPGAIEFIQNYEGDAAPPPTLAVTETTVVATTTTVPEATVPDSTTSTTLFAGSEQSVLAIPAPEFVARWDATAATVDEVLQFDSNPIVGPFEEQFTPYLSFVGEIQPDGSLNGFSLVVDPSGPGEYDRIGIQALGVAVATVEPDRSPQGRAALLGELGLNVRAPQLGGIDGSVQSNGVQYSLFYDAESTLLTLTVAPVG
jgi:hypothetical protein